MKLSDQPLNKVETLDDFESIEYGIDEANMRHVYKAFINYSDPIGSIVREATSNCFDAHAEIDSDEPIEIEFVNGSLVTGISNKIIFRDFGPGLSPQRVRDIYSKFFSSTKRDTNKMIGAKGLGAKAPLAYTDMFTVITVHDNIEYTYTIHTGSVSPVIELLDKKSVISPNMTEVIIEIKDGDRHLFQDAIKSQLYLFDNIKYININVDLPDVIKTPNFLYLSEEKPLSICMGKVVYPINIRLIESSKQGKEKLGDVFQRYNSHFRDSKIVLYCDIGDVDVVWNREGLEYSEKTITKIVDLLATVKDELIAANLQAKPATYFELLENLKSGKDLQRSMIIKDRMVELGFRDFFAHMLDSNERSQDIPDYLARCGVGMALFNYGSKNYYAGKFGIISASSYQYQDRLDFDLWKKDSTIYYTNQAVPKLKTDYLDTIEKSYDIIKYRDWDQFKKRIADIRLTDKLDQKDIKLAYDTEIKFIKKYGTLLDDVEPSEEYLARRAAKEKDDEEYLKLRIPYTNYWNSRGAGSRQSTTLKKLTSGEETARYRKKHKPLVIYDNAANISILRQVGQVFESFYSDIKLITLSKKNADDVEKMNIPTFIRATKANNSKYLRRIVINTEQYLGQNRVERLFIPTSLDREWFWRRHPLFQSEGNYTINTKRGTPHTSNLHLNPILSEETKEQLLMYYGFIIKYQNLTYLNESVPDDLIKKVVDINPIHPRLYALKYLRENAEKTDSDSE